MFIINSFIIENKFSKKYKVLVYNVDGQCVNKFQPSKWSLGVKTVGWSPSGQLLAIGSFDQKVIMF